MTTLSFHVDAHLNAQLTQMADATERSKSYIIRKAVENFLASHPTPNAATRQAIDEARQGKNISKVDNISAFLETL